MMRSRSILGMFGVRLGRMSLFGDGTNTITKVAPKSSPRETTKFPIVFYVDITCKTECIVVSFQRRRPYVWRLSQNCCGIGNIWEVAWSDKSDGTWAGQMENLITRLLAYSFTYKIIWEILILFIILRPNRESYSTMALLRKYPKEQRRTMLWQARGNIAAKIAATRQTFTKGGAYSASK